jgi:hypothetical protein
MAGINDRIEESKNWFERAMGHVPGYSGYKEKEVAREADKIQRVYVAERLEPSLSRLDDVKLDALKMGKLDALGDIDTLMRKLRKVRDRVQYADYGYAGMFDPTKVDKLKIDELMAFDQSLEADASAITELAGALAADSPSLRTDIKLLDDRIDAFDARFTERDHLITGAGR